jgi:sulfite exporter TauE/SafE
MMTAFAIGTLPVLTVLSFTSLKFQKNSLYAGTFNLIVGLFVIGFGIYSINSQLNVLGAPSLNDISYSFTKSIARNDGQSAPIIKENGKEYQELRRKACLLKRF